MRDSIHLHASSIAGFEGVYSQLCQLWLKQEPFDRGEVHAQQTTGKPEMVTRELRDVVLDFKVPNYTGPGDTGLDAWQIMVAPNLPWAEDHFQERVSGKPLNPPPAEAWWPYAQQGNSQHKKSEKFSHTYPERFWPKWANGGQPNDMVTYEHHGIRFAYGDLGDLVELLAYNPRTRQAYLPVWFPEDLTASVEHERVPCTIGYHFMTHPDKLVHMTYYMRSCDMVRFFRDDVYMAGRLLQWVVTKVNERSGLTREQVDEFGSGLGCGGVRLVISNLHAFEGDLAFIKEKAQPFDKRQTYDFGALS